MWLNGKKKKFSRHKPDMIQLLELTDRSFSITAITMGKSVVKRWATYANKLKFSAEKWNLLKKIKWK